MVDAVKPTNKKWEARFREVYATSTGLRETAERMGCTIWVARKVIVELGLPKRPRGCVPGTIRDDDDDKPLVCPYPNLPFERGAFKNFDYGDVAMVQERANG
jgi:hypothetical protein